MKYGLSSFLIIISFIAYWLFIGAEVSSIFNGCNSTEYKPAESSYPKDTSIYDKYGKVVEKYRIRKLGDTSKYIYYQYNLAGRDSIKHIFIKNAYKFPKIVQEFSSDSSGITEVSKYYNYDYSLVDSIIKTTEKGTKKILRLFVYNNIRILRYSYVEMDSAYIEFELFYDSIYNKMRSRNDTIIRNKKEHKSIMWETFKRLNEYSSEEIN
jgi:hypothetical protein